ncbi:16S rRNA (cytidine(1402)-2'-O)-methyltransferase [Propionicicella superfundia]|uniref:16S rRNA (cytidine(1402)-2'-O)-methyltransferase n=1 Tax=Propionicicella superfundia TaxID=348582 RepID=UPI0003F6F837|nr:16S rRNA (cytidine(1402)-2'-O)-methyltransferase [Propionicicella superfundia]
MTGTGVGELRVVGTPIGDAADASPAMRDALATADVIAAEDTRRVRALLRRLELGTTARIVSNFDGNEAARAADLVAELVAGRTVALVSDAGMPLVSDPGYRAVQAAIAAGIRVRVVPGPSAVLVALGLSGLPTDRFCFEGFLPRKAEQRRRRIADLTAEPRTMVFFEAPHRLADFLADTAAAFGADRPAAVCRELTKTYEEVRRDGLGALAAWAAGGPVRGEITVVIGGAAPASASPAAAVALVLDRVAAGERFSAVVAEVAEAAGMPRKELYRRALAAREEMSTASGGAAGAVVDSDAPAPRRPGAGRSSEGDPT